MAVDVIGTGGVIIDFVTAIIASFIAFSLGNVDAIVLIAVGAIMTLMRAHPLIQLLGALIVSFGVGKFIQRQTEAIISS